LIKGKEYRFCTTINKSEWIVWCEFDYPMLFKSSKFERMNISEIRKKKLKNIEKHLTQKTTQ